MIRTLQKMIRQDKEKINIPKSAAQALPVKRIWPDGIWMVGNKFSKCWRFTDINYDIASHEDKEAMFFAYSDLLNALDSEATTKITVCNHKLNRQEFETSILLPLKGDQHDGYRKEYNAMLLSKVTETTNSFVQERYITVSTALRDYEEAKSYFNRVNNDLVMHFAQLSSICDALDSVERLRIFHDFYRPGEENIYNVDLKQMMHEGKSFRDYIAPDTFEFKSDHFIMGDKYGRVLYMKDYASFIKDNFIANLCKLNKTLFWSMDIIPVPMDEAVREIENRILGIETNAANWQRRQNQNNNFTAALPYDIERQRAETKEMLDDLTSRDQRMMFGVMTMVHIADSYEELNRDTKALQSLARSNMCQLVPLKYQQMEGLNTVLPFGVRKIDAVRTFTTEAVAVQMPFHAQEITDVGGAYCGVNAISET